MFNFREVEGTYLDYKLALEEGKPKSWLKSVSAFANSHGGHILFGVTNDTQSKIVCTRWKGKEKGSVEGDALDDKEFSDSSLISLLGNAESFIRNNSKNPWTIRGMRRDE